MADTFVDLIYGDYVDGLELDDQCPACGVPFEIWVTDVEAFEPETTLCPDCEERA